MTVCWVVGAGKENQFINSGFDSIDFPADRSGFTLIIPCSVFI
jgi:hypothetical protein